MRATLSSLRDSSSTASPVPPINRWAIVFRPAGLLDCLIRLRPRCDGFLRCHITLFSIQLKQMVRDRGFEPLTPSVSRKCSTTELTAQPKTLRARVLIGLAKTRDGQGASSREALQVEKHAHRAGPGRISIPSSQSARQGRHGPTHATPHFCALTRIAPLPMVSPGYGKNPTGFALRLR
jgi:hypothetical protein